VNHAPAGGEFSAETRDALWSQDYAAACSQVSHLYAIAFERFSLELGPDVALALAPSLLPQVMQAAEAHAERQDGARMQSHLLRQQEQAAAQFLQQQRIEQAQLPQDPW